MSFFRARNNGDPVRENLLDKCRYAARHFNYMRYGEHFDLDEIDEKFLQSLDDEELYDYFELFAEAVFGQPAPQPQNING